MERLAAGPMPERRDPELAASCVEAQRKGARWPAASAARFRAGPARARAPHAAADPHPLPALRARRPRRDRARARRCRAARCRCARRGASAPEALYAVRFRSEDLFGPGEEPGFRVLVDLCGVLPRGAAELIRSRPRPRPRARSRPPRAAGLAVGAARACARGAAGGARPGLDGCHRRGRRVLRERRRAAERREGDRPRLGRSRVPRAAARRRQLRRSPSSASAASRASTWSSSRTRRTSTT